MSVSLGCVYKCYGDMMGIGSGYGNNGSTPTAASPGDYSMGLVEFAEVLQLSAFLWQLAYRIFQVVCNSWVGLTWIRAVPQAGCPLLWLPTTKAGWWNFSKPSQPNTAIRASGTPWSQARCPPTGNDLFTEVHLPHALLLGRYGPGQRGRLAKHPKDHRPHVGLQPNGQGSD